VERLALEGFDLPSGGERAVQAAFRSELARLLAAENLPGRLLSGGARRELPGGTLSIDQWADPGDLGRRIARGIYEALQR
jgi:hypothetical protein